MALNAFFVARDFGGNNSLIPAAPEYNDTRVLASGVAESHTIPSGSAYVVFSATAPFYARALTTNDTVAAAVPAADITDGTGSQLNPGMWALSTRNAGAADDAITAISLIAPTASIVTMAFYKSKEAQ